MNSGREAGLEIDLQKLLLTYLRKWWAIVLCAVVAFLGALLITTQFITPMYRASITVYVNSVSSDQEINSISSGSLSTAQKLVDTYVNMIESDTVLEKVADTSGKNISANQIRKIMSAEQVDSTEIFKVYITHADPEFAADVANSIAEVAPDAIEEFVVGSSAKIIDYAKVPVNPSSPNTSRNCILGALVGCVFAVLIITIQFLLDVRIKTEEDLAMLFDIPVLGQIPSFEEVSAQKKRGYGYASKYGYTTKSVTQKGGDSK